MEICCAEAIATGLTTDTFVGDVFQIVYVNVGNRSMRNDIKYGTCKEQIEKCSGECS